MPGNMTQMRREILEIPSAVDRLLSQGETAIQRAARQARDLNSSFLVSVARGSSDHACTYPKYASELLLGRPMASVGPSVASVYGAKLNANGAICVSVSQSGQSPDIVTMTEALRASGAMTVAITNNLESRLAEVADAPLPIHAGPELSVAATKTFVTSLVAGLWFLAEIKRDTDVLGALKSLPTHLENANTCDWSAPLDVITGQSVFTLGRGTSWAISNEAALKFKETCLIHAESYSSAEVFHGPVSIVEQDFPVIAFAAADAAEDSLATTADQIVGKGATVFATTDRVRSATTLPFVRTDHWLTDPIATIVSFYGMVDAIAKKRGINPDAPRHLNKVTKTV